MKGFFCFIPPRMCNMRSQPQRRTLLLSPPEVSVEFGAPVFLEVSFPASPQLKLRSANLG
jgi:hypothetical protein